MKAWLIASLIVTTTGCLQGGTRVVDGGRIDRGGWPVRTLDAEPYRCPLGTELVDNLATTGRRVVTCQRPNNSVPRGFELIWNDAGRLVSRLIVSPDGYPLERTHWFDNGRKAGTEDYVDGKLVRRMAWYENGEKRADLAYDFEKNVMFVEQFQADGAIESKGQMRDGRRFGMWREWRDGAIEEVEYVDGLEQGKVVRSFPTGGVEQGQYEAGRRVGTWTRFDGNGNPVREMTWEGGTEQGTYRTYHPNTQLREAGQLVNGRKNGRWRTWYPSGELESDQYYICDVLWGPSTKYYPSGELHTEGVFERGRKVGEWKVYSETGIATEIDTHTAITTAFDADKIPTECNPEQARY